MDLGRSMSDQSQKELEHTHYCDDCDHPLAILYDERPDESISIVCGDCGGTNTRKLEEPVYV